MFYGIPYGAYTATVYVEGYDLATYEIMHSNEQTDVTVPLQPGNNGSLPGLNDDATDPQYGSVDVTVRSSGRCAAGVSACSAAIVDIADAQVLVRDVQGHEADIATRNGNVFTYEEVPFGNYTIVVSAPNYETGQKALLVNSIGNTEVVIQLDSLGQDNVTTVLTPDQVSSVGATVAVTVVGESNCTDQACTNVMPYITPDSLALIDADKKVYAKYARDGAVYYFHDMPLGAYTVAASKTGYITATDELVLDESSADVSLMLIRKASDSANDTNGTAVITVIDGERCLQIPCSDQMGYITNAIITLSDSNYTEYPLTKTTLSICV